MRNAGFIVAAEHSLMRMGMVALINRMDGIRVIREFSSAGSFSSFAEKNSGYFLAITHVLFNDARKLFLDHPEMLDRTILLSGKPSGGPQPEVHGYILPGDTQEEITTKIRAVVAQNRNDDNGTRSELLTQRERTIVRLVSLGLTNKQIADQLYISAHTVITHRKNIINKLGIKSVSGLTVYAIVNNIITIEEVTSKT